MPIPHGSASSGITSGTDGSRAYFADLNAKIDRAAAAAVLDPIDKRTRHLLFFNPDPEAEQRIFRAFSDPYSSLATIAIEQHTTVEGLSAWMARPDIAQRIFHVRSSAAAFVSVASTMRLQHAMRALSVILCEYTDAACHAAGLAEGRGASPGEHIRRDRETARKACQLLMRLANFNQILRSPTNPDIRTPARLNTSTPDVPPVAAGSERQPVPATTDAQDQAALLANIKDLLAHLQSPATTIAPTANPEPAQSAPSVPSVPSAPSAPSALSPDPDPTPAAPTPTPAPARAPAPNPDLDLDLDPDLDPDPTPPKEPLASARENPPDPRADEPASTPGRHPPDSPSSTKHPADAPSRMNHAREPVGPTPTPARPRAP